MNETSRQAPDARFEAIDAFERDDPSWAHASGWAQLSGRRRTLSCLVPIAGPTPSLTTMLQRISDALTEGGYPWELLMIDLGHGESVSAVLRSWTQLPGFSVVEPTQAGSLMSGVANGLLAARGDAVLVLDPTMAGRIDLMARAIMLWEGGSVLVHATSANRDLSGEPQPLTAWSEAQAQRLIRANELALSPEFISCGLLDRRLVDWLVNGQ
jgi:hypothetical protein